MATRLGPRLPLSYACWLALLSDACVSEEVHRQTFELCGDNFIQQSFFVHPMGAPSSLETPKSSHTAPALPPCASFKQASNCPSYCRWRAHDNECRIRITWLHVMKTGGSFGTTLAHYANSSLPRRAHMPSGRNLSDPEDVIEPGQGQGEPNFFLYKYPVEFWFQDIFSNRLPGNHEGVTDTVWTENRGALMGMFRDPVQRLVSSFKHFSKGRGDFAAYAWRNMGQQTKMLAGRDHGASVKCEFNASFESYAGVPCNRTAEDDVDVALARLDGFAFVGLTEEFDLSVCLFHLMYGGECLDVEFFTLRSGRPSSRDLEDDSAKIDDVYDRVIHAKASRIFWGNVRKYGADRSTCAERCPAVAHTVFADDGAASP